MYSLKDGNPRKVHLGNTIPKQQLDDLQQRHKAGELTDETLFHQYHDLAFETLEIPSKYDHKMIWKKLTRVQKVVLTMGHAIGQIDNGGVWQLYFNQPLYAFATYETFNAIDTWVLEDKYGKVFNEFQDMVEAGHYWSIVDQTQDSTLSHEERWNYFQQGRTHLPSASDFEDYFYQPDNKAYLYERLIRYIHLHLSKLFHVAVPDDASLHKAIQKKEAVAHFTQYLTNAYGKVPEEVRIYYTGRVTIDNQATQLFLMYYKISEDWESLGITGYFTHHFANVHLDEINSMYKKYHKQTLVNLYHGWYLVQQTALKDPSIFEVDDDLWQETLQQVQQHTRSQIPVNVVFKSALRYEGQQWFFYEGDLLYTSKDGNLPEDFNQVDMEQFSGESNLLFSTKIENLPCFGGRKDKDSPVSAKYCPQEVIGNQYKLLKDNPWGF